MKTSLLPTFGTLILIASLGFGQISDVVVSGQPAPDGWVRAVAAKDQVAYLGGDFTRLGVSTGGGTVTDPLTGALSDPDFARIDGTVEAVCADGSGGWFVGGRFDDVDGVPRSGVAHILSNGSLDVPWAPQLTGLPAVYDMVLDGAILYIAGDFDSVNGVPRDDLAALDSGTGGLLPFDPGSVAKAGTSYDRVSAIDVLGTTLYAIGYFDSVQGQARDGHAAWDTTSEALLPWTRAGGVWATDLVASSQGIFISSQAFGPRLHLVDPVTAAPVAGWSGSANYDVDVLHLDGSVLYVGGSFTAVSGGPRAYIAALDAATGALLPWDAMISGGFTQRVVAIATSSSEVYFAGAFYGVGGSGQTAMAAVDKATMALSGWNPQVPQHPNLNTTPVTALAVGPSSVFIGGSFTQAGGVPRSRLASFDLPTGAVTSWTPQLNGRVDDIVIDGETLWICGAFTMVNGLPRSRVAAFDLPTGALLPWQPPIIDGVVRHIALAGNAIFFEGLFTAVAGQPRNRLAALDRVTGTVLPWDPQALGSPETLATDGSVIYVGGQFGIIGGAARNRLAALDPWVGLAGPWAPIADGPVFELTVDSWTGNVFAGGTFQAINGQPRDGVAEIDPTGSVTPFASGVSLGIPPVLRVLLDRERVYVGSGTTSLPLASLVELDRITGLPTAWNSGALFGVRDLALAGPRLLVGGSFSAIGQQSRQHFGTFALANYASVEGVAGACFNAPVPPTLGSSIPVLGATHLYAISSGAGNAPGSLFISLTPPLGTPPFSLGGCPVHLDLPSTALLASFTTDGTGGATIGIPLPQDPALATLPPLRTAAVVAWPGGALVGAFDLSNTLSITLGY